MTSVRVWPRLFIVLSAVLLLMLTVACAAEAEPAPPAPPTPTPIDVEGIVSRAVAGVQVQPGVTSEEVAGAIQQALAAQPGVTTQDVANEIAKALAAQPGGVTSAEMASAIASALAQQEGLTTEDVAGEIAKALSAQQPGVTSEEVAAAIQGALAERPGGVTEAQVAAAIESALAAQRAEIEAATMAPPAPMTGDIDQGGTLVFPTNEGIISFDLHWTGTYNAVQPVGPTYNSILTYDQRAPGVILPELAAHWEADSAGTTYTFRLRDDVNFHSGTPFTCADAKASLDKMTTSKVSSLAGVLAPYESSSCSDEYTLSVTLSKPMAAFLTALAGSRFVVQPKAIADAVVASEDPRSGLEKQESFLDGTGPFKFKSHVQGVEFVAEANPDYWKPGRPYLDGYKDVVFPDLTQMSLAFRARQLSTVGLAQHLEPSVANQILEQYPDEAVLITAPRNAWHNVVINLDKEPWNDVRVRKAIWLAIDQWETIDAAIEGWGTPGAFIGPHLDFALPEEERNTYSFFSRDREARLAEAKALMAEAGLADGFSDELLVRFGISYQKAALTAQQDLAQIGIDIEVNTVDTATIVNRRNSGEYSVMAFPSSTAFDDPDGYWARFQCDNPSNFFGYCNERFDELFTMQSQELDRQKRIEMTHEIERILLADLPDQRPYYWWQATLHWNNVQSWEMRLADWTYNHDRLESTWCTGGQCR